MEEVPLIPAVAYGQERVLARLRRLRRARITLRVGMPVQFARTELSSRALQQRTDMIMLAIADLLPPEYRGLYAR